MVYTFLTKHIPGQGILACTGGKVIHQTTTPDCVCLTETEVPCLVGDTYDVAIEIEDMEMISKSSIMTIHPDKIEYDYKIFENIQNKFDKFLNSQENFENIFVARIPDINIEEYDVIKFSKNSDQQLVMSWGIYSTIVSSHTIMCGGGDLSGTYDAEIFKKYLPNSFFILKINTDYPVCIEYSHLEKHYISPICNEAEMVP